MLTWTWSVPELNNYFADLEIWFQINPSRLEVGGSTLKLYSQSVISSWVIYYKLFTLFLSISGMIILSMCFSLIGEVVESKVKAVAVKMGLGAERVCFDTIIPKERIPFDFETSDVYR